MKKRIVTPSLLMLLVCLTALTGICCAQGQMMDPFMNGKKRACLDCHRLPNINTNEGVMSLRGLCMECHSKKECKKEVDGYRISMQVKPNSFGNTAHKYIACIQCHRDVARSPHESQTGAQCLPCHHVHGEKEAHAPHLRVRCQACHGVSKYVVLDRQYNQVVLAHVDKNGVSIPLTNHLLADVTSKELCLRCHYRGNKVGAPAAVLPSKSVLCLMCHTSPISMGPGLFWIPFLLFMLGLIASVLFWFQGSMEGEKESLHRKIALASERVWQTIFSRDFWKLLKVFVLDVILQRRLLQESVRRWCLHSLIYLSILLRFSLSLFTLLIFNLWPHSELGVALINKNNPFVGFIYDLLGLFILIGVCWAATSRLITRPAHVKSEIQDSLALLIIGILVLLGFALEGTRILVTNVSATVAAYSFIGYPISRLFSKMGLEWPYIYALLWYSHAVLGAVLIAYLPFGKMKHVISTPLNLILSYKKA